MRERVEPYIIKSGFTRRSTRYPLLTSRIRFDWTISDTPSIKRVYC